MNQDLPGVPGKIINPRLLPGIPETARQQYLSPSSLHQGSHLQDPHHVQHQYQQQHFQQHSMPQPYQYQQSSQLFDQHGQHMRFPHYQSTQDPSSQQRQHQHMQQQQQQQQFQIRQQQQQQDQQQHQHQQQQQQQQQRHLQQNQPGHDGHGGDLTPDNGLSQQMLPPMPEDSPSSSTSTANKPEKKKQTKAAAKSASKAKNPNQPKKTRESTKQQRLPRVLNSAAAGLRTITNSAGPPAHLNQKFVNAECDSCGMSFSTTSELRRHQKVQHQRQMYKCRTCGDLFSSIADRQTHKNNKHFALIRTLVRHDNFQDYPLGTELSSTRNDNGYFVCPAPYCSFETRIPGYWYDHINSVEHAGVNPQKRKRRRATAAAVAASAAS